MKEPITRRDMLKGCAAFSLGSALWRRQLAYSMFQEPSAGTAKTYTLCVCFHGLFAFVFRADDILILTPQIREHRYLAGAWRNEKEMKKGASYSLLLGTNKASPRPAVDKNNLHLTGIKNIDTASSQCLIKVPFPEQFISLRYVPAQFRGQSFTAANAPSASSFPLLQVLRYELSDPQSCKLDGFEEYWKVDPHSASQELHIFAEPPDLVPDDHAARAFDALVQIFPGADLTLMSRPGLAPCPLVKEPGIPRAIDLEQELSLSERDASCGATLKKGSKTGAKGRGPQTGDCFGIIVNNP